MPCKLTFRGDSKLVTKISTLLRPAKADCKKPTEIKCKAESILTAADENPRKKLKTDDSEPVSSSVICVDDNTLHTVSPKVWIAFERKVLSEADKGRYLEMSRLYYHSVQSNVAVMTVDYLPLHFVLH